MWMYSNFNLGRNIHSEEDIKGAVKQNQINVEYLKKKKEKEEERWQSFLKSAESRPKIVPETQKQKDIRHEREMEHVRDFFEREEERIRERNLNNFRENNFMTGRT